MATDQMPERPALLWVRADGEEVEFPVWPERPVTIGRDATNTIAIDSPFVSKSHAVLQYQDGGFVLQDLRSANGTRVNGADVEDAVSVSIDDEIEVGDQRLLFVDRGAGADARPARGAAAGGGKTARLLLVAVGTAVVMGVPLMMMRPARKDAASTPAQATKTAAPVTVPTGPPATDPGGVVAGIEALSKRTGVKFEDALLDEGQVYQRNGRLLEAEVLFAELVRRTPSSALARTRLDQARVAREVAIQAALADGERMLRDRRFQESELEFERVIMLTVGQDARRTRAEEALREARTAGARSRQ